MFDPTKTLAVCDAATEGPWVMGGFRVGFAIDTEMPTDPHSITYTVHHESDATFIAQARTELPAYAAFARDVLALHRPDWSDWGHDHPEEQPNCTCGYNGAYEDCPTVQLAAKHGIEASDA